MAIFLWFSMAIRGEFWKADFSAFYTGWSIVLDGQGHQLYNLDLQTKYQAQLIPSRAVTSGLLETMNRVELEGVIAHELSHVKNYDILVTTVAVTAVGAIALLSDLGLRFMWFGGRGDRRDSADSGGLGIILVILAFALLILAPFIALLMQFAVSRRRELLADASGVQLTRYPPGLVAALEKLKDVVHHATRATAQMWIESPLERGAEDGDTNGEGSKKGSWLNRAFDTHPPLDERIRILKEM